MRLTFKDEMQQIWIASATSTQKGESRQQVMAGNQASLTSSCNGIHTVPLTLGLVPTLNSVPYNTITKIEGFKIDGKEEYSIIAVSLGAGDSSKYWLYFFPSQHVASLKIRILGVESLL